MQHGFMVSIPDVDGFDIVVDGSNAVANFAYYVFRFFSLSYINVY
jgi:hypothetical protein